MENATDALEIAFAVMLFVIALTIAITMFSQLNSVSQIVLNKSDITTYYSYGEDAAVLGEEGQSRIVGLETVIPTLYKYYKENYTVIFLDKGGSEPLELYNSKTNRNLWSPWWKEGSEDKSVGIIGKYYADEQSKYEDNDKEPVCSFDVDEETLRHEPWTGSPLHFKKNLDAFLNGKTFPAPSGNSAFNYNYGDTREQKGGFINRFSGRKFKETLGEYTYNLTEEDDQRNLLLKERKKRVIVYELQ